MLLLLVLLLVLVLVLVRLVLTIFPLLPQAFPKACAPGQYPKLTFGGAVCTKCPSGTSPIARPRFPLLPSSSLLPPAASLCPPPQPD